MRGWKKPSHARGDACQRAPLVEDAARDIAFEQWLAGDAIGDQFPELAQPLDPPLRRVAGDQAPLMAPIEMPVIQSGSVAALRQGLVDAGLIGAERTAALQHEAHLRAVRRERFFACFHTLPAQRRRPVVHCADAYHGRSRSRVQVPNRMI